MVRNLPFYVIAHSPEGLNTPPTPRMRFVCDDWIDCLPGQETSSGVGTGRYEVRFRVHSDIRWRRLRIIISAMRFGSAIKILLYTYFYTVSMA